MTIPARPQKAVIDGKPTYTSASSLQTAESCPRKWFFAKVLGIKTPPSKSQAVGTQTHGEIEHYLKTGELTLGQIPMAGKHLIPEPSGDYLIEHRIWDQQLSPAGIPLEGFIDLVVPGDVVEVLDWKTTSNLRWAKKGSDLPDTIQMAVYARWAQEFYNADTVRLSHVYFQTKGRPQATKSTILVDRARISRKWESIEKVARSLHDFAAETEVADVPANRMACDDFGGCAFYSQCPRKAEEIFDMSVLDDKVSVPEGFVEAWEAVKNAGRGLPSVNGELARIVGYISVGADRSQESYLGTGELAGLPTLHDPSTIMLLAQELAEAAPPPEPPAILPPDAPKSRPELAALPVKQDPPLGVLDPADAKKLKKGDLIDAYLICFDALMQRDKWEEPKGHDFSYPIVPQPEARVPVESEPFIYVNCVPPVPCERLETYIFNTVNALAESAGEPDIRCSNKDMLAFGKWRGVLAAAVKESPPQGSFTVTCKGDDFAEVVVGALEGTHQIIRGF